MLPVASTRNSSLPAEYSASWIDMVSLATVVGVRVVVGGRVEVGVDAGPVAVGTGDAAVGVGVRVCKAVAVAVGVVGRLITNERTLDQAPLVPLAVRPRTRHQKVPSLVRVWVVWVCVIPVRESTGELKLLESSIWIW